MFSYIFSCSAFLFYVIFPNYSELDVTDAAYVKLSANNHELLPQILNSGLFFRQLPDFLWPLWYNRSIEL